MRNKRTLSASKQATKFVAVFLASDEGLHHCSLPVGIAALEQ
jgi:hypothetical protein